MLDPTNQTSEPSTICNSLAPENMPVQQVAVLDKPTLAPECIYPWSHQNQIPPITFSPSMRARIHFLRNGSIRKCICTDSMSFGPPPKTTSSPLKIHIWPALWWALPKSISGWWSLKCPWEMALPVQKPHFLCRTFPLRIHTHSSEYTSVCLRRKEIGKKKVNETPKLSSIYLVRPKRTWLDFYKRNELKRMKSK